MQRRLIFGAIVVLSGLVACTMFPNMQETESYSTIEYSIPTLITNSDYEDASYYAWDSLSITRITLNGTSIEVTGSGASVNGVVVNITAGGAYIIEGTLDNGQVVVNSSDGDPVQLILSNASISCSDSSPLVVENARKAVVILADGSENILTDSSFSSSDTTAPDATLFSRDDLFFSGSGSLIVNGNAGDAIVSNDGLVISGGNITVNATDDGIRGKDFLIMNGGSVTVNAGGDGIKSSNDETTLGYVLILGGKLDVESGADAIQAESQVQVSGGTLSLVAGGGVNSHLFSSTASAKGLKAGRLIYVSGGTLEINTPDDALNSNDAVWVQGGDLVLSAGDDGIHGDTSVTIDDGTIEITTSYEGIEGAALTVNGGTIHLSSSDDGFNATRGISSSSRGGMAGEFSDGSLLTINGGYIVVTSSGDGLDANGCIVMTGGTLLVNGPTASNNGAIDYNSSFTMSGGLLIAAGSSGMAQAPSTGTQYSVKANLSSTQSANTIFHVQTSEGTEIFSFAPSKNYSSVSFSSPALAQGNSYIIYLGGSDSGTKTDGLYENGSYTAGTKFTTFSIASTVTSVGRSR